MLMPALICSGAESTGPGSAAPPRPIVIGQIASLTGNNPGGRDNELGAALAAGEINAAGGLLGQRRVEIVIEDDATQVQGAVSACGRLLERHPVAIIGTSFSNAGLAVIPDIEKAAVPYVSTGAADAQVEPIRRYVFMTPLTGKLVGEQLLRYLQFKGVRRLAVVYDSDSQFARDGWAKQRLALTRFGIQLVAEQAVKVDTRDFAPQLRLIPGSGAEAIMGWVTGPPAVGLVKAYGASDRLIPLFLSHGAASPAFIAAVGQAGEGATVATALAAVAGQLPDSAVRRAAVAMSEHFTQSYGHAPSQFAIDGYVAVKLIAAALTKAGVDQPQAVQQALTHLSLVTPQGEYRYSADDHSGLQMGDVAITEIRDGKFALTSWSKAQLGHR